MFFDVFSIENIINWFLGVLPIWVPWTLINTGVVLFVLSQVFSKLITLPYRLGIPVLCFALVFAGAWTQGRQSLLLEDKKVVEKIVTQQVVVTKTVVQKVYVKEKQIEENHDKLVQQINTKDDHMCVVPDSFVRVHDSAAKDAVPGTTTGTNDATTGITISTVEKTIADNYETYYKVAEQLKGLQEWVTKQKELSDHPK